MASQRTTEVEAAGAGQHDVENNQVGHERPGSRHGDRAIAHRIDFESLEQEILSNNSQQIQIVFDDEHALLHANKWCASLHAFPCACSVPIASQPHSPSVHVCRLQSSAGSGTAL